MNIWLTIILAGILTYAIRLSFIVLQDRIRMPDLIQRGLRFVPPAVFTAVFLPEMFLNDGVLNLSPGNARLLSGLFAIVVAWRTKNVMLTIVVGMLALWILQVLIG
jgi:branched-subunit amino acid transport protein